MKFEIAKNMTPKGDQPQAIKKLVEGLKRNKMQTLLGITGSGKTFTMANVIEKYQKPTLIISHNKTLAAQLYRELKELFPNNAVEYFISYYDYYQPESYLPSSDTYIEKDAKVNPKIDQMRLAATASLTSRSDVIIVASVSCIYSLGDPNDYATMTLHLEKGQKIDREELIRTLLNLQYKRNDVDLHPGSFRVKGDIIDVAPASGSSYVRIELFGDEIEYLQEMSHMMQKLTKHDQFTIFPAKHFVIPDEKMKYALESIKHELGETLPTLEQLEAHRLKQRTNYDLEMMEELGYCGGQENYSRHFDGRKPGQPPHTLINYFPDDFLLIIDESHQTIPQLGAMYKGDKSRKDSLIEFGFRLPSASDNRPLQFKEFEKYLRHTIFMSATPSEYEKTHSGQVVEQIIRPTGLVDPSVEVRPIEGQIADLHKEIVTNTKKGYRTLLTTLTKRMAEELTEYLQGKGVRTRYLHSEIDALERTEIIRDLRAGEFDVLVGINLLREGLDIPEVALVAILDADKEGFLRNYKSLIQTIGRAARNAEGHVILYADTVTESMKQAINETKRRREKQIRYNEKHGITPKTIIKAIPDKETEVRDIEKIRASDAPEVMKVLEKEMKNAAANLDFELAIELRERIGKLRRKVKK